MHAEHLSQSDLIRFNLLTNKETTHSKMGKWRKLLQINCTDKKNYNTCIINNNTQKKW